MQTLILGFDAFDPAVFERLYEQGRVPNLARYVEAGGYARFAVSNPPQSEVSWTSIATGLNPGEHGMFDFVHRDPATYGLTVSLLPTESGVLGTQFVRPYNARTIFDQAVDQGYSATALWWPGTFPARPGSPVRTFPGLGTPDIHGRLGAGTLFTTDTGLADEERKTAIATLERIGKDCYGGRINGPIRKKLWGTQETALEFQLDLSGDGSARLTTEHFSVDLVEGQWSPILDLTFRAGFLVSIQALTRVTLTQVDPEVKLYMLPLQLHPLHSPWRYATPGGFVRETWQACGPFLTLGWPQDTTALEEGYITDHQFLDLCESIFDARQRVLMHHLEHSHEGVLASVFDSLDRIQHMFWRDRPDIVDEWYVKLDALVGKVEQRLAEQKQSQTCIVIVSDHGFTDFDYKVHLNRWLIDRGHLVPKEDSESGSLQDVDWSRSHAYAIGLNSIYLNLADREGEGCVSADQYDSLINELRDGLLDWRGPDGNPVVQQVWRQNEAFTGWLSEHGPDVVVGFSPGYRASSDTGLGRWGRSSLEPNHDHWGADHCMDPQAVAGVVFSNGGLSNFPNPSYHDIPALTIGAAPDASGSAPPSYSSDEDQKAVEERLKDLGYF